MTVFDSNLAILNQLIASVNMAIIAAWENLMDPQYVQIPQENGKRAWKVKIYLI